MLKYCNLEKVARTFGMVPVPPSSTSKSLTLNGKGSDVFRRKDEN